VQVNKFIFVCPLISLIQKIGWCQWIIGCWYV
jgi:hypothetical protein